jgi:hypothetical protein
MEPPTEFFIYKNRNKTIAKQFMNNLDWEADDKTTDLANPDKLSIEHLQAMRLVARMKEAADKAGAGFVGGFISPTGQRFMMSNVDNDDIQVQAINEQLNRIQQQFIEDDDNDKG